VAILKEYAPSPGILGDLPQVSVTAEQIIPVCVTCRDDAELDCRMLLCLACVDYEERFELVYFLQSLANEKTLVIRTAVPYEAPSLSSVSGVWPAADWYEREAHDLFGVAFQGHPDLSPLLLYPEFEGFPGRKEFEFYEYREF
jgi:NADH-quinone oxidoreductase subunit C